MSAWAIATAIGLPTAFLGMMIWWLQRKICEVEKCRDKKDENRKKFERGQVSMTLAAVALSAATARAVQRIPQANCNGDMANALKYAEEIKRENREFLASMGVDALF